MAEAGGETGGHTKGKGAYKGRAHNYRPKYE